MRNVPRGLPLWSSQCIFQKPIQAPASFNAGTSFQHTTHQRVASLTPPGSLQVAATILRGIFTKNTENNQFSPSNHQLYTGLQKIRVQLAVSQRSSLQGEWGQSSAAQRSHTSSSTHSTSRQFANEIAWVFTIPSSVSNKLPAIK